MDGCITCAKPLGTSGKIIACGGFCGSSCHFECSAINTTVYNSMTKNPNIIWVCNSCKNLISNNVFKKSTISHAKADHFAINQVDLDTITQSLSVIKSNVEDILDKVNHQSTSLAVSNVQKSDLLSPKIVDKDIFNPSNLMIANTSKKDNNVIHTAPQYHTRLQQERPVVIGTGDTVSTLQVVEPRKTIFVSRLHKTVNEAEVVSYIKDKFNIEDVNCQRIVSNRTNEAVRQFSSFKINVAAAVFDSLLRPCSWPTGSLIKEFINYKKGHFNKTNFPGLQQNHSMS